MASLIRQPNGRRVIQFYAGDRTRRSIRLGAMPAKLAEQVRTRVEALAVATGAGLPIDLDTAQWVQSIDDTLADRLAAVGLIAARPTRATLGAFLDGYLADRRAELKPAAVKKLTQTTDKLRAAFGDGYRVDAITVERATAWRRELRGKLSEASTRTHTGNAKTIFGKAVAGRLIGDNPFAGLASGSTASNVRHYVEPADFARFLDALPSAEWRLLFALPRYAGLRCPSETHGLTWADVDFDRRRLFVRSPKTERHAGHESRTVPIVPELLTLLQAAFDAAAEGQTHPVTIRGTGRIVERFKRACRDANVTPWPRLFQTLRSSAEIQLAMSFPQFAVSRWIGHSLTVSGKHYANHVPDELFDRAAGQAVRSDVIDPAAVVSSGPAGNDLAMAGGGAKSGAIGAKSGAASVGNGSKCGAAFTPKTALAYEKTAPCGPLLANAVRFGVEAGGIEPPS